MSTNSHKTKVPMSDYNIYTAEERQARDARIKKIVEDLTVGIQYVVIDNMYRYEDKCYMWTVELCVAGMVTEFTKDKDLIKALEKMQQKVKSNEKNL